MSGETPLTEAEIRKLMLDGYHDERWLAREVLRLREELAALDAAFEAIDATRAGVGFECSGDNALNIDGMPWGAYVWPQAVENPLDVHAATFRDLVLNIAARIQGTEERHGVSEIERLHALHVGMIERDGMLRSECCTCAPRCARCGRELGRSNDAAGPVPDER